MEVPLSGQSSKALSGEDSKHEKWPLWKKVVMIVGVLWMVGLLSHVIGGGREKSSSGPSANAASATSTPIPAPAAPATPKTKAQIKKEAVDEAATQQTVRDVMAKVMENQLLSKGFNVDVDAMGSHHTTLRIKWVLVSKVTAYQFTNDSGDLFKNMREAGFTKFVITDGYDETWTWKL